MQIPAVYVGLGAALAAVVLHYSIKSGPAAKELDENTKLAKKSGLKADDSAEELYEKIAHMLDTDRQLQKKAEEKAVEIKDPATRQKLWDKAKVWVKWGAIAVGVVAVGAGLTYVFLRDSDAQENEPADTEGGENEVEVQSWGSGSYKGILGYLFGSKDQALAVASTTPAIQKLDPSSYIWKRDDQSTKIIFREDGNVANPVNSADPLNIFAQYVNGELILNPAGSIIEVNAKVWLVFRLNNGRMEAAYVHAPSNTTQAREWLNEVSQGKRIYGLLGNGNNEEEYGTIQIFGMTLRLIDPENGWMDVLNSWAQLGMDYVLEMAGTLVSATMVAYNQHLMSMHGLPHD